MKRALFTSLWFFVSLFSINVFASVRELTLPAVPADLKDVSSRAAYVITHFWDNMDFSDSAAVADTDFMEQNFANFAGLMPLTSLENIMPAVADDLMAHVARYPFAYNTILSLAEVYLYDYDSPMRYEQAFVPFMENALNDTLIDSTQRLRLEFMLEEAMKNAPGTVAADVTLVDKTGKEVSLSSAFPKTPFTVMLLYDPDCSHCISTIGALASDPLIEDLTAARKIAVLAVDISDDTPRFNTSSLIPSDWFSFISSDPEFNETEAYALPSLPVIYLLDKDMTVILKEATPQQLVEKISTLPF